MSTQPQVRRATQSDVAGMAATLATAFHDDPVMCWLFGDEPPRPQRWSEPFFASEGRRHLGHHTVYTADGHPGAAYWDPPGHWKVPPLAMLRMAPLIMRAMGRRAISGLRGQTQMEKIHAARPPHYYLAVLGTRPERQGEGIGAALMRPVLTTCDADGVGAYLESSKESNIPYYERHGFGVVDKVTFPGGPSVWPMWRDPRDPGESA